MRDSIITDVMVYSGFKLKGYEVIDFDYLEQLLSGAHFGVFNVFTQEVISMFSEIEGDFPSPEETRRLISSLFFTEVPSPKGHFRAQN